jgi:HD-GYP domain-containing protein (c-di-GMP phosphodiesterase class II)
MLKKIPVKQLRLGMHLHKLEGAWMAHSFWKTKFVVDSTVDLERLHTCGVAECWVDTALGLDVAAPVEDLGPAAAPASQPPVPSPVPSSAPPPAPPRASEGDRSMAAELKQAADICSKGRKAVNAMFNEARMGRTVDAEQCLPLVEEISGSVQRNPGALVSLARLKSKDDYSYMHSVATCALMVALGRQLKLDEDGCRAAGLAGLLHDIGKAVMPLDVLNKPGKLTEDEFKVIRTHPEEGHRMVLGGQGVADSTLEVVLHHHERMDGTGYPHQLAGEQINPFARMGAICDVYDAITSNRPYKAGWDPAQSIARMASWKGHFDTAMFASFVQSLGIYPTGSLVRLASGKLAVVAEQNPQNLVSPVVVVFFSTKSQLHVTPGRLDLSKGTSERIVAREENAAAQFPHLDELWADPDTLRRMKA